ncbi:MAG: Thymidylate synthase [Phycisphaerales bacterium]|nr:Thymidylate synthase [Phycisphaerales bacterium]
MSTEAPIVIEHSNLSVAWSHALLETMKPGRRNLRPIVLTIGEFQGQQPPEVKALRDMLDQRLVALGKNASDISALTIFPYKMWVRRGRPSCGPFSELCVKRFLPRMRKRDRQNQYGTYFERMMAFSGTRRDGVRVVNQLQFVIDLLNKDRRPRESALQITCFDPAKDHTGQPVRGFPCLQQVGISYDDGGQLAVNAFYPMQYIFDRAYGNYLGLCHLGEFLAHETQLRFSRLTCFIGKPELGDVPKRDLPTLVQAAKDAIEAAN